MRYAIVLLLLLAGCQSAPEPYYDPKPKTNLPDLPKVKGAGKITVIPEGKLTDEQKDQLIVNMRRSEKANAEGYNARGRAYDGIKRIYQGK